jgi:putative ABC transport system permease protein
LKETFPEVLNTTRLRNGGGLSIALAEKKFDINRTLYADPGFFKMFTTRIIQGEAAKMLEAPGSLVLTDETAGRLFGREDPVGRLVQVNSKNSYTITGVIKKMPSNSHLQFDAMISLSTRTKARGGTEDWMSRDYLTYLELRPGVNPVDVLPKFQQIYNDKTPEQLKALKIKEILGLQPLTRIHLNSRTEEEIAVPGNPAYIRLLTLIAFFILLLAGINFVTLSTARAGRRAKEVGVRKVLGAERRRLICQFLGESVLLSLFSLAAAVGLIYLLLPLFNRLIVQNLSFRPFQSGAVLLGLLGLALVVGLLAGLYPALVLSGFSPQKTLKSQTGSGRERRLLRHGLVTFQYVVSIALICCTLIVQDQLRYLKNYNLGYNKDQLVEFELSGQLRLKRDVFKAEVLLIPGVEKASLNGTALMRDRNETLFVFEGAAAGDRQVLPRVFADADYLPTLGASLAAGRNFDRNMPTDRDTVILNETLVRRLGWTEPLGKTVKMLDTNEGEKFVELPYTVVGVVKDYFFESLHAPLRGQVIVNRDQDFTVLLVKLRADALPTALGAIQQVWKKFEPERPFEYAFVSETFDRLYRADQRLGKVFFAFTLLALFVAGLGLFGLAAFTAERRTKEIGIRKVLGASVANIMALLTRDFVRWVLLANVIAWPVAYLAMKSWTRSFAYRADFNPFLFLAAGAAALILAILTVSLRTLKTSTSNPSHSLRYE